MKKLVGFLILVAMMFMVSMTSQTANQATSSTYAITVISNSEQTSATLALGQVTAIPNDIGVGIQRTIAGNSNGTELGGSDNIICPIVAFSSNSTVPVSVVNFTNNT